VSAADDAAALAALDEALAALAAALKRPDVAAALTVRGVNASLALTAAYGLEAYVQGDKAAAIDELSTAVEEIATRSHHKA
jgi:hypothetical protein